jgi:hypothetical protein
MSGVWGKAVAARTWRNRRDWHFSDVPSALTNVRHQGQTGRKKCSHASAVLPGFALLHPTVAASTFEPRNADHLSKGESQWLEKRKERKRVVRQIGPAFRAANGMRFITSHASLV